MLAIMFLTLGYSHFLFTLVVSSIVYEFLHTNRPPISRSHPRQRRLFSKRRPKFRAKFRTYGGSPSVDVTILLPSSLMVLSAIMIPPQNAWFYFPFQTSNMRKLAPSATTQLAPNKYYSVPGSGYVLFDDKCDPSPLWASTSAIKHTTNNKRIKRITRHLHRHAQVTHGSCFTAALKPDSAPRSCRFDSDSIPVHVDNCASRTTWTTKHNFTSLRYFTPEEAQEESIGVGGKNRLLPTAVGTLTMSFDDDNGTCRTITIDEAFYVPDMGANLFCPQQWASQQNKFGDTLAHCDTRGSSILLEWTAPDGSPCQCTVPFNAANVGILYTTFRF